MVEDVRLRARLGGRVGPEVGEEGVRDDSLGVVVRRKGRDDFPHSIEHTGPLAERLPKRVVPLQALRGQDMGGQAVGVRLRVDQHDQESEEERVFPELAAPP